MQQQGGKLVVAVAFADHVVVVQHQDDWLRQVGQLVDQQRKQGPGKIQLLVPEGSQRRCRR